MDRIDARAHLSSRTAFEASISNALRKETSGTSCCAIVIVALHPSWAAELDIDIRNATREAMQYRLEGLLVKGDALVALDGEQWGLLLANVSTVDEGGAVAARIADVVSRPVDLDGETGRPLVSTGVAVANGAIRRPADLVEEARTALALAIEQGPGQIVLFDEALRLDILRRFRTLEGLGRGFELAQLELWYQPIFDIHDGSIVAAEALLRWPGGVWMEGAAHIMSAAERTNLMDRLNGWVVENACRQAARWAGHGLVTHINMSPRQLVQPNLTQRVLAAIERAQIQPNDIAIEVTESSAMPDPAIDGIREMSDAGLRICLDDFGTGYANLAALRALPIDMVKLDRTVVAGIHDGSPAVAMVEAVVGMATALCMRVTAEGIETQEELETIDACGCDLAQGYLLSRPMAAEALEGKLSLPHARRLA